MRRNLILWCYDVTGRIRTGWDRGCVLYNRLEERESKEERHLMLIVSLIERKM